MTAQEALHEVSTMVFRNTDNFEMAISKDCYKAVVNALELQIPQKPIRTNRTITKAYTLYLDEDNEYWKCPICTRYDVPLLENQEHCHFCGQALDWRKDNGQL